MRRLIFPTALAILLLAIPLSGEEREKPKPTHSKCEPGRHVSVENRQTSGAGCTKKAARAAAYRNLATHCTGEDDPQCPADGKCAREAKCSAIATDVSHIKNTKYKEIKDAKCGDGVGWEYSFSADFNCRCGCR